MSTSNGRMRNRACGIRHCRRYRLAVGHAGPEVLLVHVCRQRCNSTGDSRHCKGERLCREGMRGQIVRKAAKGVLQCLLLVEGMTWLEGAWTAMAALVIHCICLCSRSLTGGCLHVGAMRIWCM